MFRIEVLSCRLDLKRNTNTGSELVLRQEFEQIMSNDLLLGSWE